MTEPIYKLYLSRPTEAWFELSWDERQEKLKRLNGLLVSIGGERVIQCDSTWSSDEWPFWGVEKFPNLEAAQKYAKLIREAGIEWPKYVEAMSILGVEDS